MLRGGDKKLRVGGLLAEILDGRSAVGPPVPGYIGWWDAADVSSLTVGGGTVSQWNDKSGNGYHLTQATGGFQPAYSRTINGITVLEFDGSDDLMLGNCPRSDISSTTFVVALLDNFSAHRTLVTSHDDGGLQFRVAQTSGQLASIKEGIGTIGQQGNATATAGVAFAGAAIVTASDVTHNLNGTSETDAHAQTLTGGRTMRIGSRSNGVEDMDGLIGEIIIYDTALGSTDVNNVMAYLKAKWGTP